MAMFFAGLAVGLLIAFAAEYFEDDAT